MNILPSYFFEYAFRASLIAIGLQWVVIYGMDLVLVRRKSLFYIQAYMVTKTFIDTLVTLYVMTFHLGDLSWRLAALLFDRLVALIGYGYFVWTFSDDPVFVLGLMPINEAFCLLLFFWVSLVNRLEGRAAIDELIGPFHPLDMLIPVLIIGSFYAIRPLLIKLMQFFLRVYYPHRIAQILVIILFYGYAGLPEIVNLDSGYRPLLVMIAYSTFAILIFYFVILFDIRAQNEEKNLLEMQMSLIERRAYLSTHLKGETDSIRTEITRQMDKLQEIEQSGENPDPALFESYIERLNEIRFQKYSGTYCSDVLVDEMLKQISEAAQENSMAVEIVLRGYELGNMREEDLVRLLYYLGYAGLANHADKMDKAGRNNKTEQGRRPDQKGMLDKGDLKLQLEASGNLMQLTVQSPQLRLNRSRISSIRRILQGYKGKLAVRKHVAEVELQI